MNTTLHIVARTLLLCGVLFTAGAAFAEEGVSDNTIRIGQTVGVTGQISGPVKEMIEGANAYITSVNKRGGVNGPDLSSVATRSSTDDIARMLDDPSIWLSLRSLPICPLEIRAQSGCKLSGRRPFRYIRGRL